MTAQTAITHPALEVRDLALEYRIGPDWKSALRDINFTVERGESFGLVGESGCGKSTVAMAIMHYLPRNGRVTQGSIRLAGRDVTDLSPRELRDLRVNKISMVYQNPGTALNPSIRIGRQVEDVFELMGVPAREREGRVRQVLDKVQIADPIRVMRR